MGSFFVGFVENRGVAWVRLVFFVTRVQAGLDWLRRGIEFWAVLWFQRDGVGWLGFVGFGGFTDSGGFIENNGVTGLETGF